MDIKNKVNYLGTAVMILSLAFLIYKVYQYGIDLKMISNPINIFVLSLFSLASGAMCLFYSKIFQNILSFFITDLPKTEITYIYCKANLYKYLPGNFMHYIGRNQIAIEYNLSHSKVIASTLIETVFIIISGVVIFLAFSGRLVLNWILLNTYPGNKYLLFGLTLILIVFVTMLWQKKIKLRLKEYVQILVANRKSVAFDMFIYSGVFIINGLMFIGVMKCSGITININIALPIIGLYCFSWIIGFITPGAPAGLGIREVVMSAMLFGAVEKELVISAVVLYRIVTIFGDFIGFIIAFLLKRIKE